MNNQYVDEQGNCFRLDEAEIDSPIYLKSSWLIWTKRWCYVLGSRVFLASSEFTTPYEMINLLDIGTSVNLVNKSDKSYCVITGVKNGRQFSHVMRFLKYTSQFCVRHMQEIILGKSLKGVSNSTDVICPYKCICVSFLTEWLLVKELGRLDSSLCNRDYRRMFLSLFQEHSQQITRAFFNFPVTLSIPVLRFLLSHHTAAPSLRIKQSSLLSVVMDHKIYSFSYVTDLIYETDSDLFYSLLQQCIQIKSLTIYFVRNSSRLISALIVHNRRLVGLQCNSHAYTNRSLLLQSLHHRFLSILPIVYDSLAYRAGVWYQQPPAKLTICKQTLAEIAELCHRTTNMLEISYLGADSEIAKTILTTQQRVQSVKLMMFHNNVYGVPECLARCIHLTHLTLSRTVSRGNPNDLLPLDWSHFSSSSIRLRSFNLFMLGDDILQYMTGVLSTATSLTISNHMVTDDQLIAILSANGDTLTDLSLLKADKLSGQILHGVGWHCRSLQKLHVHRNMVNMTFIDFEAFCSCGSVVMSRLFVPAKLFSRYALDLLILGYPAVKFLYLDCIESSALHAVYLYPNCEGNSVSVTEVEAILTKLGTQLIQLGLENCDENFKESCTALRKHVDRCCEIV